MRPAAERPRPAGARDAAGRADARSPGAVSTPRAERSTTAAVAGFALSALCASGAAAQRNCADVIASGRQLSRATTAMQRTGLLDVVRGIGPSTISAVTDFGIARRPKDLSQKLFPQAGSVVGGSGIDPIMAPAVVKGRDATATAPPA